MSAEDYTCLLDSGVHTTRIDAETVGYGRELVIVGWHRMDDRMLGLVEIQVGRQKIQSYARFLVWTEGGPWKPLFSLPIDDWWHGVQAYNRSPSDKHTQQTNKVVLEIIEYADVIGYQGDV